jgi:organic radical activating enzyme
MSYAVKEIFYTLQGEGVQTGRAAVFCRFVGCNLWSGHEKDRASAICKFCDTDFLGTDGLMEANSILKHGWQTKSNTPGNQHPLLERSLWYSPEANRSCNWTVH